MKTKFSLPRFFVVIHCLAMEKPGSLKHVLESAYKAHTNGADGVFLIPDYEKLAFASVKDIIFYYNELKQLKMEFFKIGVNFLLPVETSLKEIVAHVYQNQFEMIQTDGSFPKALDKEIIPDVEIFSGLAFKYSSQEKLRGEELKRKTVEVSSRCDVVTTSGVATGSAADLDKIKEIRSYLLDDKRLGLASGVTLENIYSYLDVGVTDFLVASSLIDYVDENDFDVLDGKSIKEMTYSISNYRNHK